MYKTTTLPKQAFTCIHFIEFYRLLERKRVYYADNITLRYGLTYYIYSEHSDGWYRRTLADVDPEEELGFDILLGYVKIEYSEEEQDEIKKIMQRDNIKSYKAFVRRCVGEYRQSTITKKSRNDKWTTEHKRYTSLRNLSTQSE